MYTKTCDNKRRHLSTNVYAYRSDVNNYFQVTTIGGRIARARGRLEWGQDRLAGEARISRQSVSNYETDKRLPGVDELLALAGALGVRPEWLLTGEEPEERGGPTAGELLHFIRLVLDGTIPPVTPPTDSEN